MSLASKKNLIRTAEQDLINKEDLNHALEFTQYYSTVEKLTKSSTNKYYYACKHFLIEIKRLGYTVVSLDEKGALGLMSFLHGSSWSEDTRADYWDRFTRFYAWVAHRAEDAGAPLDNRAYRLLVDPKHKKVYKIDKNRQEKKGILSEEEVVELVELQTNLCYKVFFAVLYESGMRSQEAFSLLLRDVEAKDNGSFVLHLRKSKTVKRPIPLQTYSVPYLRKWLRAHPEKRFKDAKLFFNTKGEPLNNFAANKELKGLLKASTIDKRKITLHSFRHSRATHLASKGLSEFEMCRLFGWSIGSRMPATYIREGAIDVTTALRKANGLPVEEQEKKQVGTRCLHCEHINSEQADFCDICSLPLAEEELKKIKGAAMDHKQAELLELYAAKMQEDILNKLREELNITTYSKFS